MIESWEQGQWREAMEEHLRECREKMPTLDAVPLFDDSGPGEAITKTTFQSGDQTIRAVIYEENGMLVGQCLEYDIGAQASSMPDLMRRMRAAIDEERALEGGCGDIPRAPKRFFERD